MKAARKYYLVRYLKAHFQLDAYNKIIYAEQGYETGISKIQHKAIQELVNVFHFVLQIQVPEKMIITCEMNLCKDYFDCLIDFTDLTSLKSWISSYPDWLMKDTQAFIETMSAQTFKRFVYGIRREWLAMNYTDPLHHPAIHKLKWYNDFKPLLFPEKLILLEGISQRTIKRTGTVYNEFIKSNKKITTRKVLIKKAK